MRPMSMGLACLALATTCATAGAGPAPAHAVVGGEIAGTWPRDDALEALVAVDASSTLAHGYARYRRGVGRLVVGITLDCVSLAPWLEGGHLLHAAGRGDDGQRYHITVSESFPRYGDAVGVSTETVEGAPCDAAPPLRPAVGDFVFAP